MTTAPTVVCIHGIWGHGASMVLLRRHFENEYDFSGRLFSYPSVTGTLDENADRLEAYLNDENLLDSHIVAHSLGGVIALRMLARRDIGFPGRVVCLGSPLSGSRAASFLSRQDWAESIIGRSLPEGTVHSVANDWAQAACERNEVGIIAGSIPIGIGQLTGIFKEPSDGTVTVAETRLDGAKDHITLQVSHMGMLISRRVADQAAAFIKRGEFLHEDV